MAEPPEQTAVLTVPDQTQPADSLRVGLNWFLVAVVLGLVLRVWVYATTGWTILDGLIGFRFAEQFSAGNGLVFNAGERVSGNTSVLYTLFLGLAGKAGLDIPVFSRIAGVTFDVCTVLLTVRILRRFSGIQSTQLQYAVAAALFLFPLTLPYSISSMETSLYVALIFLVLERTLAKQDWKYWAACGALMYCRPDGVVFVAMSLLYLTLSTRRIPWRSGLVIFCLGLVYLGFNRVYYGTVVPNTVLCKAFAYHDSIGVNFHYIASRFLKFDLALALLLAAMLMVAVWFRKCRLVLLTALMAASFFVFLLKAPHLRSWYVIPFLYLSFLLLGAGAALALEQRKLVIPRPAAWAAALLYVAATLVVLNFLNKQFRGAKRYELATREVPGLWLKENTPANARVFVTALEVGYYSKRYTVDSPGLVTPAIWKMLKKEPALTLFQQADRVSADYVLIPLDVPGTQPPNFELLKVYKPENAIPPFDLGYALYKRSPTL